MNGFLISTTMNKEYKAFKEFSNTVDSFVNVTRRKLSNFTNFTDSLAEELNNLKIHENFIILEKYRSILILKSKLPTNYNENNKSNDEITDISEDNIINKNDISNSHINQNSPSIIFSKLRDSNSSFHAIKRIIPLDFITNFDETAISAFIQRNQFSGSFKIQFEGRLCQPDLKTNLFKIIIPLIQNKVDLNTPEYVIVIQAFKGLIGLTIIKNDENNFNFSVYSEKNEIMGKNNSNKEYLSYIETHYYQSLIL